MCDLSSSEADGARTEAAIRVAQSRADPAVDAAAAAIRAGSGSEGLKNRCIETLAWQYDLRKAGPDNPPSGRSTLELAWVLEQQIRLESERRDEERLRAAEEQCRLNREADLDTAHIKTYMEVFKHLYGNMQYPLGHAKRGGILNTYPAEEANT